MQLTLSRKTLIAILTAPFASVIALRKTEHALIVSAKGRNRDAFDRLMESHASSLRKFIARRVNPADRDDIFQETCLSAWISLPSFDSSSRLRTWLYSICYHKIQDHWRQARSRPPSGQIVDAEGWTAYLPSEFGTIELQHALKDFWGACSPDQRELLRLYYSDGLTLNEIASVLSRNLNTVKYQFYKAHSDARETLLTDSTRAAWMFPR